MALVATVTSVEILTPRGDEAVKSKTKIRVMGTMAWDASYSVGGELVDALFTTAGYMSSIDNIVMDSDSGYIFKYLPASGKIMAFFGDNNNAADGPLIEIPDTTNLSALTAVPFVATGSKLGTGVGSVA